MDSGNMQSRTPIPPPRLPPPRVALQDVTARANQSPLTLPPIGSNMASAKPSMGKDFWERAQAKASDETDSLRNLYQQTAVDLGTRAQQAPAATPTAARTPTVSSSSKRKSDASSDDAIAAYKQSLDHIDTEGMIFDKDCNAVRALIRKVIERGIFKKGEFCNTIGVSSNAVNRFLEQSGRDKGMFSDAYSEAWAWFKQREIAGLSMPAASAESKKKAKTAAARLSNASADLNSIHLDGEETDSVPVYETCDVVRRKITAHLKTPGLTQAQFCRDLYAQLKTPSCKSIQATMLTAFRNKKGPLAGCTSSVYYAAYVYFEKLRLAEGKPKSKHRLEMEAIHPGGVDRERDPANQSLWVHDSERVIEDEYGRLSFVKKF